VSLTATDRSVTRDSSSRAGSVTGALLISRLLGLGRDMVLNMLLGAGPTSDALRAALKIPSMFRDLVAEGSVSAAFLPSFEEQKVTGGLNAALRFSRAALTLLLLGSTLIAVLLWHFAPAWMQQLAPGLEKPQLALQLFNGLLPFLLMVPFLAILRGLLLAADRNRSAMAAQALQNATLIGAGLWMVTEVQTPELVASGWTWAFLIGAAGSVGMLAISCRTVHPIPLPTLGLRAAGTGRFCRDLIFQLLASSVTYINSLMAIHFATLIGTGAVTYLDNAFRFHFLPVALIGVALGTIAGVDAARLVARKQSRALAIRIGRNLRNALFISLPAAVGLAILADPLIRVLLQRGQFTAANTTETVAVLKIFCVSIPFACLCPALIRTSMALGLRTLLMPASVAALLVNWTLLASLEGRWGVPGLAAASVISTITSWIIFEVGLRKHLALPRPRFAAVLRNVCVVVAVASVTGVVLQLSRSLPGPTWVADLFSLIAGVSLGMGITIVVGRATGAPEVRALQKLLRSVVRVFHRS